MKKMKWLDEYSVGDEILDKQHKIIINLINKLIDNPTENKLQEILDEMMYYIRDHFHYEEYILRTINFPDLEEHIEEHHRFIGSFDSLTHMLRNKNKLLPDRLFNVLYNWFMNHILIEDMKYKPLLEKCDDI